MRRNNQAGYTLVELLLALAIFSFVLIVIVTGFFLVIHQYESAVAMRKAQQNVRYGIDDMARELRRAADITGSVKIYSVAPASSTLNAVCIKKGGGFSYYLVQSGVLNRYDISTNDNNPDNQCKPTGVPTPVTGSDVFVVRLLAPAPAQTTNTDTSGTGGTSLGPNGSLAVDLIIKVSTVDVTKLDANANCQPGAGSSFCATAAASTTVEVRGGS